MIDIQMTKRSGATKILHILPLAILHILLIVGLWVYFSFRYGEIWQRSPLYALFSLCVFKNNPIFVRAASCQLPTTTPNLF
jgi:hypothetical protein